MVLCTKCSEDIKPVVAIDIDGTMGDFHYHFVSFALTYLRGKPTQGDLANEYDGSIGFREWFCRRFQIGDAIWYDIKLAYRQGAQKRSMPCRTWASNLTLELSDIGCEIWVTTTRPYLRMDNIDPDTRFWLDKNSIMYDYLIYDEDKYSQLLSRVGLGRVVAVVEDLPDQAHRAGQLFGESCVILYRGPHNRVAWEDWPVEQLAHGGESVKDSVMKRVNEWIIENQGAKRAHSVAK